MQIMIVKNFIMIFNFLTNCNCMNPPNDFFFSFLQIMIIKMFMITLLRFANYEIALILKINPNATPMVKRVARRAFILFNLEHALH